MNQSKKNKPKLNDDEIILLEGVAGDGTSIAIEETLADAQEIILLFIGAGGADAATAALGHGCPCALMVPRRACRLQCADR